MMKMRNLDNDIATWRQQLFAAGIKSAEVLDELENHLRDDLERRIRAGADAAQVFGMAVAQFGPPQSLKTEFEKVQNKERKFMKKGLIISAGIIGIMVGMALVMPAVAQYRHEGAMKNDEPWLFLIGSLLTLAGCVAAIRSLKRVRA
jgi:hypothetical protein